jgi:hypothetical protein
MKRAENTYMYMLLLLAALEPKLASSKEKGKNLTCFNDLLCAIVVTVRHNCMRIMKGK